MPARSKARKRALDVLFEAELRDQPVLDVLAERATDEVPPLPGYAADLVRGVHAHQERIDELIAEHAQGWALERMPAVDRNLLRIGAYELLWADDIPDAVAISEAVQLARDLSTESSPVFVNGLLARLLELRPTLTSDRPPAGKARYRAGAKRRPRPSRRSTDRNHRADTPAPATTSAIVSAVESMMNSWVGSVTISTPRPAVSRKKIPAQSQVAPWKKRCRPG